MDAQALLLVMQTPKAASEQQHADWYVSTHLPDVCAISGTLRGEYLVAMPSDSPRWTNAAAYWLNSDPEAYLAEVLSRAGSGQWQLSATLDPDNMQMMIANAITPRILSTETSDAGPKDRLIYIVLTNPTQGDDEIFNDWYSNTHIPDVLKVPGFTAAQRFRFVAHPALGTCPFAYAALYEIRASEAEAAFVELGARAGTAAMMLSPTLDTEGLYAAPFAPVGILVGEG